VPLLSKARPLRDPRMVLCSVSGGAGGMRLPSGARPSRRTGFLGFSGGRGGRPAYM